MISIKTYSPQLLSPYIKSFWCLKVSEGLAVPYVEEILPDWHHEIVFHLNSSPLRKRSDSEKWDADPAVFFAGQNRKSYIQQLSPGAVIYAVRFHPHTQSLFYKFPASLSTDKLVSFSDMAADDILLSCIDESPEKTFSRLEKEFVKRVTRLDKPAGSFLYVDAAVRRIINQQGNVNNEALEKLTGVSARHLEKSFQKLVGLSPKQFCTIIRYNRFITFRKNNPGKTFTECGYEAGFYDQSHLIRLSHSITGQSPKAYFDKLNYINDFFLES